MNLTIRIATPQDIDVLSQHEQKHISRDLLSHKITHGEVTVAYVDDVFVGWLRHGLFWDGIPFMNLIELLPEYHGKGIGTKLTLYWEAAMKAQDYTKVMTSTQQDETAQHFYTKLGYRAIGGFAEAGEAYEILFEKHL